MLFYSLFHVLVAFMLSPLGFIDPNLPPPTPLNLLDWVYVIYIHFGYIVKVTICISMRYENACCIDMYNTYLHMYNTYLHMYVVSALTTQTSESSSLTSYTPITPPDMVMYSIIIMYYSCLLLTLM